MRVAQRVNVRFMPRTLRQSIEQMRNKRAEALEQVNASLEHELYRYRYLVEVIKPDCMSQEAWGEHMKRSWALANQLLARLVASRRDPDDRSQNGPVQ